MDTFGEEDLSPNWILVNFSQYGDTYMSNFRVATVIGKVSIHHVLPSPKVQLLPLGKTWALIVEINPMTNKSGQGFIPPHPGNDHSRIIFSLDVLN